MATFDEGEVNLIPIRVSSAVILALFAFSTRADSYSTVLVDSLIVSAPTVALIEFAKSVNIAPNQATIRIRGFSAQRLYGDVHVRVFDTKDDSELEDAVYYCFADTGGSANCQSLGMSTNRHYLRSGRLFSINDMFEAFARSVDLLAKTGASLPQIKFLKLWQQSDVIYVSLGHNEMGPMTIESGFVCQGLTGSIDCKQLDTEAVGEP